MSSNKLTEHDKRIYNIAEEYRQRGYGVTITPSSKRLPEFLRKFRPDILAEGPNESVVIEVKSFNKARPEKYWSELTNTIQQHPGWRFELIIGDIVKREPPKTIGREQISKLLEEGQRLAQEKMLQASLLITWSAIEAAMRLASKRNDVDLPDFRPTTVIGRLYTDGVLEREDYYFLLDCMRLRNAIAHGFRGEAIKSGFVTRLRQIASQLLDHNQTLTNDLS